MSDQITRTLLNIYQKRHQFVSHSQPLVDFCRQHLIGEVQKTRIFFARDDYSKIARILEKEFDVDPATNPQTLNEHIIKKEVKSDRAIDEKVEVRRVLQA